MPKTGRRVLITRPKRRSNARLIPTAYKKFSQLSAAPILKRRQNRKPGTIHRAINANTGSTMGILYDKARLKKHKKQTIQDRNQMFLLNFIISISSVQ